MRSLYIVCRIIWVEVELQSFWTSALDGGEWSASDPDHFIPLSIMLGGPRDKPLASAGIRTLYHPSPSLVAISTSYCSSPYCSRSFMLLCTHKMRKKTQIWLANVTQKMVEGAELMVALYTWVYRTPESRGTALSAAARIANTFPVWTNISQWNHNWLCTCVYTGIVHYIFFFVPETGIVNTICL